MSFTLEELLNDTEHQLATALKALQEGDAVDLAALAPRIQTVCDLAVAGGRRDVAPRLLAVTASLDALEALLKERLAAIAAAAGDKPADHRRVNDLYRTAKETLTLDEPPPSKDKADTP